MDKATDDVAVYESALSEWTYVAVDRPREEISFIWKSVHGAATSGATNGQMGLQRTGSNGPKTDVANLRPLVSHDA